MPVPPGKPEIRTLPSAAMHPAEAQPTAESGAITTSRLASSDSLVKRLTIVL